MTYKIALIPARGGSKRLPDKNIKLLNGKPLIAWTIIAARESGLFDDIIVSTDSENIASLAKNSVQMFHSLGLRTYLMIPRPLQKL